MGHGASLRSSSVFLEGTGKPPLSPKNCQTETVSSELHSYSVDYVEICRQEQREEWFEWA